MDLFRDSCIIEDALVSVDYLLFDLYCNEGMFITAMKISISNLEPYFRHKKYSPTLHSFLRVLY